MTKQDAKTTINTIRECLANPPAGFEGSYTVQGGNAFASGMVFAGFAPARIPARGGDARLVTQQDTQQIVSVIDQLLAEAEPTSPSKDVIDSLMSVVREWGPFGIVVTQCVIELIKS